MSLTWNKRRKSAQLTCESTVQFKRYAIGLCMLFNSTQRNVYGFDECVIPLKRCFKTSPFQTPYQPHYYDNYSRLYAPVSVYPLSKKKVVKNVESDQIIEVMHTFHGLHTQCSGDGTDFIFFRNILQVLKYKVEK